MITLFKLTSVRLGTFKHKHTFTRFRHHMRKGQSPLTQNVIGGIVGITQHENTLDKFFIIAPELSKLQHEFATEYVRQ